MRIKEAHIFGFGKWQQKKWPFNDDEMVQITGENEAGKSTLRQFILYVLFGQKPREVEKYIPNDGAVLGGRLLVAGLDKDEVTIERVYQKNKNKAIIYFSNGTTEDEGWLQEALLGMDRSHYESIFSFDSMDLQRIKTLHHDDLHEVLLTIGMIGSERIYETEKKLDKELQLLFKPYGKKPIINTLLQELKELKVQLASAQEKESVYEKQLAELQERKNELGRVKEQTKELEKKHSHLEKMHTYYPNLEEYYLLSQKRKRIDAPAFFPSDGLNRLHQYKESILPLKSQLHILKKNRHSLEKEIEETIILSQEEREQLFEQEQALLQIEKLAEEINHLKEDIKEEEKILEEKLTSLHLNRSQIQIEELSLSFQTEEEWSAIVKEKEQLVMEESYIKAELEGAQRKDKEIEKDIVRLQEKKLPDDDYNNYITMLAEQEESVDQAKQSSKYKQWKIQYKKLGKNFLLLSLVIVLVAVLLGFLANPMIGYIGGAIALLLIGGYSLYGKTMDKWLKPEAIQLKKPLHEEELLRIQILLEEQQELDSEIAEYKREKTKIQREIIQLEERLQTINRQEYRLNNRIQDQVIQFPFLDGIPVSYWPKLYPQLEQLKVKTREILDLKVQLETSNEKMTRLKEKLSSNLPRTLEEIESKIEKEKQTYDNLQFKQKQYNELILQQEEMLEKIRPYEEEMQQLFDLAKVDNEDEFIAIGENYTEAKRIEDRLEQLKDSLVLLFKESDLEQWSNGKIEAKQTIANQLQVHKEELDKLENKILMLQKEISDRQAAISVLEASSSSSVIRYELSMKQEELRHYAHQWGVYQYALASLEKTKTRFSEKYLPLVLENASRYFNELTLGNYIRMYFDEENQSLMAEHRNGFTYTVDSLSQGTLDQLYIALRLGLAYVTSPTLPLPFLIDDGFVHFDSERKKQMYKILEEISARHQVIYFSTVRLDSNVHLQG